MKIKTLATGSTGNAYLISDDHTQLLLECGIPLRQLMRGTGFTLSGLSGCLVTHEHQDHAKSVKDLMRYGVPVYTGMGTADALGVEIPRDRLLRAGQPMRIGTLTVMPFDVLHDAAEPLGWLLCSEITEERLLFATDTRYLDYTFPGIHHIMVECNHMGLDSMSDTNAYLADRVIKNHMSLDECLRFLARQDLSCIADITLLHLSNSHSDPIAMQHAVAAATGCIVRIAQPETKK